MLCVANSPPDAARIILDIKHCIHFTEKSRLRIVKDKLPMQSLSCTGHTVLVQEKSHINRIVSRFFLQYFLRLGS